MPGRKRPRETNQAGSGSVALVPTRCVPGTIARGEAIQDVQRRFRVDPNRITLHGFSMGGAGAWHLGLHHPAMWSSVGPGAGFVDFYRYQKQTEQRPPWQHANLGIYDAIDYALNAFNVPVCTYGGENDAQLVASTSVHSAA